MKQYERAVKSDPANVDTYKLDLTYARITAPVSGRVGLRQVDPGNYVTTGDTNSVVVITQLQPISVIFTTSEDNLAAILKPLHAGTKMSVTAYDRANTTSLESGYLETVDNQIDTTTGTIKLRATFDNKESMLFPNQFVNTKLLVRCHQERDHRADVCGAERLVGRVRVCRQAGQHRDGAQREGRLGRRRAHQHQVRAAGGRARDDRWFRPPQGRREDHDSGREGEGGFGRVGCSGAAAEAPASGASGVRHGGHRRQQQPQ